MEIPRHWRLKAQRYRLVGSICQTCGQVSFPPRPVCMTCHCNAQTARWADGRRLIFAAPIAHPEIESAVVTELRKR